MKFLSITNLYLHSLKSLLPASCFLLLVLAFPQKTWAAPSCTGSTPADFNCPQGYAPNITQSTDGLTGYTTYSCNCETEDENNCKKQQGQWNAQDGICYSLDRDQYIPCNRSGSDLCPEGYSEFPHYRGACYCAPVKFKGKALIIRPEECDATSLGYEHSEGATTYQKGIQTALGCIPTDPTGLVAWIFKFAIYIGGGVAFLLMCWGVFLIITSAGNPEQLKAGQEIMVSAGGGLIFIAFAVFMLRLIGADILKIPGFQ